MLTPVGVALSVALGLLLGTAGTAQADSGGVTCPPNKPICVVIVDQPGAPGRGGSGGTGGSGAGAQVCKVKETGQIVPCYDRVFGWWSYRDGCYYKQELPPPASTDPAWQGHYPIGSIYSSVCPGVAGTGGGWVWFADPPPGYGPTTTPAALALQAVDSMRLSGPVIGMTPSKGRTGLVGLPVWLWTSVSATTWGPASATASVPALTVTATARAQRIVWDMGDGDKVTCTDPGTPYAATDGDASSPTCGYVYSRSSASQPGHTYTVTATTTWNVTWTGGGRAGALTVTRVSTSLVSIGELQVLVS